MNPRGSAASEAVAWPSGLFGEGEGAVSSDAYMANDDANFR